jgi:sugar lactone lactonase YvrE
LNTARLEAQLAQPSGLAVLPDGRVVFADSESSAIRFADPASDGNTGLLAGSDENLFDFGDVDGASGTSRLQHPLGVVYAEGSLWVADTYNSKIKRLDPVTTEIGTFAGGDQGWADGVDARFSEPGGLSYADGSLYVADTNNHAIRVIDLTTGATRTMVLFGIERFPPPNTDATATIDLGTIQVAPGAGTVELDVVLPAGYKINDLAPFSMEWATVGVELTGSDRSMVEPAFPVEIPAVFADGSVAADITVYYCEVAAAQLCLIEQVRLTATIDATGGASSIAPFRYEIAAPG